MIVIILKTYFIKSNTNIQNTNYLDKNQKIMKKNQNQYGYFYIINEPKGTVVCTYKSNDGTWFGIAKCDPQDKFNKEFGKELARKRTVLAAKKCRVHVIEDKYSDNTVKKIKNMYNSMIKDLAIRVNYFSQIEVIKEEIKNMCIENDN